MKTLRTVVIAVACVLLVGVAVEAAELFSPPVFVGHEQLVACELVNTGGQTRTVQWEIIDAAGNVSANGGPLDIGPGQIAGGGAGGTQIYGSYYCHFIVQGIKGQYRAAIKLRDLDPNGFVTGGDLVVQIAD
jgi:hypothetical protein